MIYYIVVFTSSVLLSTAIILIRKLFYRLAENTLSLLDSMLEEMEDEFAKQKIVIRRLTRELASLGAFFVGVFLVLLAYFGPLEAFAWFNGVDSQSFDTSSWMFWVLFIAGTAVPFIVFSFIGEKKDYTEMSILLHRLILNNYNIAKALFSLDYNRFKKKLSEPKPDFVVVTGLARAGTTALTTQLFNTGKFHSLDYSNMPFLLSPNIWKTFYKPSKTKLKERSHGDNVMFGYNTVEALEEFFYKAYLNDSFVKESTLTEHSLDEKTYKKYLSYHSMIKGKTGEETNYLAKNNNLILRYASLREQNSDFLAFFLFREPLEHAYSLLKQHKRFSELQKEDSFVLEYMDWLGHYEFGLHHKYFEFENTKIGDQYDPHTMEYWVEIWTNYYTRALEINDDRTYFIEYKDYLEHPKSTMEHLGQITGKKFNLEEVKPFVNDNRYTGEINEEVFGRADKVYQLLLKKKSS